MIQRKIANITLLVGIFLITGLVSSCSKSTKSSVTSSVSDKSQIQELIDADPDLFSVDPTEDEDVSYSPTLISTPFMAKQLTEAQEATLPVGWGRRRLGVTEKDIDIHIEGNTAYVTITKRVEGTLYVDRTDDHIRNPGSKPIDDRVTKKAYFEKVFGHWQLLELSCVDIELTEQSKQTVSITSVEAIGTNSQGAVTYTITSPSELMNISTELPTFLKGTEVKVIATVENSNQEWTPPVFVFLHYGKPFQNHKREQMFDDGTHGDEVAGDGKYTNTWTIGSNASIYRHAAVDVLDAGCLQNEDEDDYNSVAWRIPYKADK